MKNICFINGSLRGKEASSLQFINEINRMLSDAEHNKEFITVRARLKGSYPEDILKSMSRANAMIMAFPLFSYGIPGALMRLLEDYYGYIKSGNEYNKDAKVYVVVNCGFPRPKINEEAVRVMKNFCQRLFLDWRFAICIGSGPVAAATQKVPLLSLKLKKAFNEIAQDVKNGNHEKKENYYIKPVLPEPIILMIKAQFEKKMKAQLPNK